ncbi:hypothetical protein GALL_119560 [mine drainage metagenome]|uniref:Uncharacterized protein n=1 Tax=mine drainage metagenome TaxID=410659 RepID=A0A1J5SP34_9ZZZZ
MPESDKRPLNWDIQLNFEHLEARRETPPVVAKIPPRQIIGEKFPKILERIELLWCSLELHRYLEQTLFTDRSNRQGFPKDVMQALGEIHVEHTRILKLKKLISEDVWDI